MPVGRGETLCTECEKARVRALKKRRDYSKEYRRRIEREDPRYKRFYGSKQWEMLSRQTMVDAHHKCEDCGGLCTEVHHDPPIQTDEGWAHRYDPKHLHALCTGCHNKRHNRFQGRA